MNEHATMREKFMDLCRSVIKHHKDFPTLEVTLATYCASFPEPYTSELKKQLIKKMRDTVCALQERGITEESFAHIDAYVNAYEQTTIISLHQPEDVIVPQEVIERYIALSEGTEGMLGIPHPLNSRQCEIISKAVFARTGLVKYYISNEKMLGGKITAESFQSVQDIPLITLAEEKKATEGAFPRKELFFFGNYFDKMRYKKVRDMSVPFYVYQFITQDGVEHILLSSSPQKIGEYVVTGMVVNIGDNKHLTKSARLNTKLPYIIAQKVFGRQIKFKNHQELCTHLDSIKFVKEPAWNIPFTMPHKGEWYKLQFPGWFKHLIWAWLLHEPKGIMRSYPMHLMMIAEKSTGKSTLINALYSRSNEMREVFSGSQSTIKSLVPSFHSSPPQAGYMAESNRFGYLDEFFRCLFNARNQNDTQQKEEAVGMMNDLLEHQEREAGSGVGRVRANATARFFAFSNPIKGVRNMYSLLDRIDNSFLSRWLIYFQNPDHIRMIRKAQDETPEKYRYILSNNDFLSIIDYCNSFSATYEPGRVKEIKQSMVSVLSPQLLDHYDARHSHHIECLIDGIVKTRCIFEQDKSFTANEQDYATLKLVWTQIIASWFDEGDINRAPPKKRRYYMPENAQFVLEIVLKNDGYISANALKEQATKEMTTPEFIEMIGMLTEHHLIYQQEGIVKANREFTQEQL